MVTSVFATAKYEMAVILPKEDKEAEDLLRLSALISLLVCSALFVLVLVFKDSIITFLEGQGTSSVLIIVPFVTGLAGMSQAEYYFVNRSGKYVVMAGARVIRSVIYSAIAILLGFLAFGGKGLIYADAVSYLGQMLYLGFNIKIKYRDLSFESLKRVAKKYIDFPKYLIASGVLEKSASHAPVILLTHFFGALSYAGFFSFAQRLIQAPGDLVSRSIGEVFRQKANEDFLNSGQCTAIFKRTLRQLVLLGTIPFLAAFFLVEPAFSLIFGKTWATAGEYAQIMMPMFFLQFITSPLSTMFVIANKQKFDLALQIFLLGGVVGSFAAGHYFYASPKISVLMFSSVYAVKYLIELTLSYKFSRGG